MFKYPRTTHVRGSRFQHGDHDMEAVPFEDLKGKHLVVEEKIDGANAGISFDNDGQLLLQSRGHYLRGGYREKHFNMFKQWATVRQDALFDILENRYVMYGEWMFAKHTFFYDVLPHYFMEFDIYDVQENCFLSTQRRKELIGDRPVSQVLVLHEGEVKKLDDLRDMIDRSHFISDDWEKHLFEAGKDAGVSDEQMEATTDFDKRMEGLYIKVEEDGKVIGRHKFVRESFTSSILDSGTHWLNRPIVRNRLAPEVVLF